MYTIGFVISHKNNEKRRALLPGDLKNIRNLDQLYFEKGYGESVGYADSEYATYGVHIVSREEALACDVIVDVKLGDADYLDGLKESKILCGWAHSVQNIEFTSTVLNMFFIVTEKSPARRVFCTASVIVEKCPMTAKLPSLATGRLRRVHSAFWLLWVQRLTFLAESKRNASVRKWEITMLS